MPGPILGVDGIAAFGDARNFRQNIRGGPWGASAVGVCGVSVDRRCGAHLIKRLRIAAYDGALLYVARHPTVEISVVYRLYTIGGRRQR